ncbi:MAG: DUF2779 domain-containing protein [Kiritimatiellaeota bacterium]|nr:DUF2779 domain-containing protein [Kiritimatiellota bacterium]
MLITKTNYMAGLQCSKLLWTRVHRPKDLVTEGDDVPSAIERGQEVGIQAQSLFPGGIAIDTALRLSDRITATRKALLSRKPIYEAAIAFTDFYAQIDILVPVRGGWDIVEVKSTTDIEDHFIQDVAFQKYVCDKSGLPIHHTHIATLNQEYVKRGPIRIKKLFCIHHVSNEVKANLRTIPTDVVRIRKIIAAAKCPKIPIGPQCSTPVGCPLMDACWSFLPKDNIFELYQIGNKKFDLFENGIIKIKDIPQDFKFTKYQAVQVKSLRTHRPHIDAPAIAGFLSEIEYPVRLLDFETFSTPIPIFDGTKPYQQIPFQYSLHVLDAPRAKPVHHSFLAEGRNDPRPKLLQSLKHTIGRSGTILVFYMAFEKNMLKQMAQAFPAHRLWVCEVLKRINDLIIPFRKVAYYHPRQHGSNSLKRVMPALTKRSYDNLPIADGSTASQEFLRVTFGDVSTAERRKIRNQLLRYCGQDTGGMIGILRNLQGTVKH